MQSLFIIKLIDVTAQLKDFLYKIMLPDFEKSVELKEQLPKKWSDFLMETIADQL